MIESQRDKLFVKKLIKTIKLSFVWKLLQFVIIIWKLIGYSFGRTMIFKSNFYYIVYNMIMKRKMGL